MKKKIFGLLNGLKSPTMVGVLSAASFNSLVYQYYAERNDLTIGPTSHGAIYKTLEFIDQKTLDIRFLLRGPIEPKERIAILAVDDTSIAQLGRWPWSRDLTGEMIDRLMNEGAKAMGFDMVFSEPQIEKSVEVLTAIEKNTPLPPNVQAAFATAKAKAQPDQALAQILNKHRDKLVLGAFYEPLNDAIDPHQDLCYGEAFKRSEGYSIRANEEWPPFIFNDYYQGANGLFIFENTPFETVFTPIFEDIEKKVAQQLQTELFGKTKAEDLTLLELTQIRFAQERALSQYCSNWLDPKRDTYFKTWEKEWPKLVTDIPALAKTQLSQEIDKIKNYILINPIFQTGPWTVNIPELRKASAHNAMFSADLDSDGTIRRASLFYRAGMKQDNYVPSLALQTYLVATGYQANLSLNEDRSDLFGRKISTQFAVNKLEIKDPETDQVKFNIPVDNRGYLKINYAGPQKSHPYLPASELFHDRPQIKIQQVRFDPVHQVYNVKEELVDRKEFIKDRIFIAGVTAVALYDLRTTPFEKNYPGVETHANVLANLISQSFLSGHPLEFKAMIIIMIFLGLFTSALLHFLGATWGLISTFLTMMALAMIDKYFLFSKGIVVGTIFPMLEVFGIYLSMTVYKYFTEEKNKKQLRATFSKYVSPAIVDEILKDSSNIELGGKKQKLSVFFSDVRGFTTISEKLDPQVLSSVLNEYLTPMTNIVFQNKGTLDKYMGDAVMAFFGAPIPYGDHAQYACRCALQSMEKLKEIQANFKERGLPMIDIGIGINTADVSVGNMGSDIVRSYTVMGDGVNLGSRLEGINKEYGTHIIISEFTQQEIGPGFTCREIDWVRVKGKNQPIKIYELISEGATPEPTASLLETFNKAYLLYRQQNFSEARELFLKTLAMDPNDSVSQLYIERCDEFIATPPPPDWDGVFVMKTK